MKNTSRRGVTIIELVMVIVIVGILAGVSSGYINQVIATWQTVSFRMDTVSQMRIALDRMSREMRQINNTTSVLAATSNAFRFNSSDGSTITYNVSGTDLLRNNTVLATGVTRLAFSYYNVTGGLLANPDVSPDSTDIRHITVELEVRSGGQNKNMTLQVFPRNLGD
jgi:prepilin-type N-terminal cleavage/methylation domain-containing protein